VTVLEGDGLDGRDKNGFGGIGVDLTQGRSEFALPYHELSLAAGDDRAARAANEDGILCDKVVM